ncbi:MAG: NADH-quinone oxidoreductase subunit C [Candidatus Omnitrophica bacterium]|nr:NADH-quinone oxidoreductase subunit C [Candidatus Omnitrophota bacterium]
MTQEEKIKQELSENFPFLKDAIIIKRERRIFLDVAIEQCSEVFDYLVKNMQFDKLSAITGLDEGDSLAVIYHLSRDGATLFNLRTRLSRDNPSINSVTPYFSSADIYERELMDLLGIKVIGLPEGHRYPLADDWPKDDFPLRKDWKSKENTPGHKGLASTRSAQEGQNA